MPIDDRATQRALDRLIAALPGSAAKVSSEMAQTAQVASRAFLADPMGPLAESIRPEGPDQIGTFAYRTRLGPIAVYGRQRELGGPIDPVNHDLLTAHYRAPGYWTYPAGTQWAGEDVFTGHVFQVGQHYLKRGVETSFPAFLRIARKVWGDLMRIAT
jgi:hypothetical protein